VGAAGGSSPFGSNLRIIVDFLANNTFKVALLFGIGSFLFNMWRFKRRGAIFGVDNGGGGGGGGMNDNVIHVEEEEDEF